MTGACTTAAVRQRAYRRRQRAGVRVLPVAVDWYSTIDYLIASGRLGEVEALDDAEVARAAARLLEETIRTAMRCA